jgi:hypothetical protein
MEFFKILNSLFGGTKGGFLTLLGLKKTVNMPQNDKHNNTPLAEAALQ